MILNCLNCQINDINNHEISILNKSLYRYLLDLIIYLNLNFYLVDKHTSIQTFISKLCTTVADNQEVLLYLLNPSLIGIGKNYFT
jgi:hypothetical protein